VISLHLLADNAVSHSVLSSAVTSSFMTFLNMSCLGVILQVMGHDGMSALQNGTAAYL